MVSVLAMSVSRSAAATLAIPTEEVSHLVQGSKLAFRLAERSYFDVSQFRFSLQPSAVASGAQMEDDMSNRIRSRSTCILAFMFGWMLADVQAQPYPSQAIRIVVGTAPSTPPDIISRVIATEVAAAEGWRIVVENRPGAINTIAAAEVLRQPADGYSIF